MTYEDVIEELKNGADGQYKAFNAKIVCTGLPIYGVRTPALRALGKRIGKEYPGFVEDFFARETYSFEEVLLCGWQTGKDAERNIALLKRLIPRMDCWAHTDQVIQKFRWVNDRAAFLREFGYLKAGGEIETRAFVMMLFALCTDESGLPLVFAELPSVPQGRYYVDMAIAWLVCEVIVKHYADGVRLLQEPYMTAWVQKKAVSKCRDSFRLSPEQKSELKALIKK